MTASDPVPAITEAEATGDIAAIYADIRATLGVPVVNLIWRYLATMPGALAWTWGSLRPLYASGQVASAAAHLQGALDLPDLPPWPASALAAAGLDAAACTSIRQMLATYDRGNSLNLVALSAFRAHARGEADPTPLPATAPGTGIEASLPPLIPIGEMAPALADLVHRLNAIGDPEQRVLASLYRHLAHWPPFLALAWTRLAPLDAAGAVGPMIARNRETARGIGRRLAAAIPARDVHLDPAVRAEAEAAVDLFIGYAISRMVPLGAILSRSMPDQGGSARS